MKADYIAILLVFLFGLGFLIGLLSKDFIFTGKVVEENSKSYSWTKAVCNEDNECVDVLIECKDGKVFSLTPVSDLVKQEDNWTDPREELSSDFCG